jgi:hypothetical protein
MISNSMAAKALDMDPQRLKEYAQTDQLGWNTLSSGNTVKHARLGLLKWVETVKQLGGETDD